MQKGGSIVIFCDSVPSCRRGATIMIDNLLEGNKKFRENEFSNHIDCYQNLAKGQNPKVLWLGCSDSRVNPERLTVPGPGSCSYREI